MAFITIEDLTGKIEAIVFPKVFEKYQELIHTDEPIMIHGKVNMAEEPRKLFPEKIQLLKQESEERVTGVRINLELETIHDYTLDKIKQVLLSYRGSVPTHLIFETKEGRARLPLGEEFLVNPTPQMAARINEISNKNSVKFIVDGKVEQVSPA